MGLIFIFTLLFIAFIVITLSNIRYKKWYLLTISVIFIVCMSDPKWLYNQYLKDDGYKGRLDPIESEINKIDKYKKATRLILNNYERVVKEDINNRNNTGLYRTYPHPLSDSIVNIQVDSLNLRFIASPMRTKIEKKDTTIVFENGSSDYNMLSNWGKDKAPYSIYRHRIYYSTKSMEENSHVTKLDDKFYYIIYESDEY